MRVHLNDISFQEQARFNARLALRLAICPEKNRHTPRLRFSIAAFRGRRASYFRPE